MYEAFAKTIANQSQPAASQISEELPKGQKKILLTVWQENTDNDHNTYHPLQTSCVLSWAHLGGNNSSDA